MIERSDEASAARERCREEGRRDCGDEKDELEALSMRFYHPNTVP